MSQDGQTSNPTPLEGEVNRLRSLLSDTSATLQTAWRLTPTEDRIFRVLLAVDIATRDAISESAGVKARRTQGVHLSRMRAKLNRHNVEIETVQGKGWRLVGREAWRKLLSPAPAA